MKTPDLRRADDPGSLDRGLRFVVRLTSHDARSFVYESFLWNRTSPC